MRILFDMNHPVDINYFKNAIKELSNQGHEIVLTYRHRGKLGKILENELGEFNPIKIGIHYSTFFSKILGQLKRDYIFLSFQRKNRIELSVCFGPTNAIASWLNRIPYLAFEDDFEYKIPFYHASIFATRHIMPNYIKINRKNAFYYKGIKELAYLHPKYFKPNLKELDKYGLIPYKYVFIRKVDKVSLNYKQEDSLNLEIIKYIKGLGLTILLSLENKSDEHIFKNDCIVLKEPVDDIFSLIKYSLFAISSGDSVAREACLLAVPTIYVGGREMLVNDELIKMECMYKEESIENVKSRIKTLQNHDLRKKIADRITKKILDDWDNPTEVILKHVKNFEN